jgi:hypothetical protein
MKRRALLSGALLFFPLGCCATSYMLLDPPWKNRRVERLRADADARVPVGSTRQQVEEWFASHNIHYGRIGALKGSQGIGYSAYIQDSAGIENASIAIEFYFDEHDRVVKYFVVRRVVSL